MTLLEGSGCPCKGTGTRLYRDADGRLYVDCCPDCNGTGQTINNLYREREVTPDAR